MNTGLLFVSSCKPRPRHSGTHERRTMCFPLWWFRFCLSNSPRTPHAQKWCFHDAKPQRNPAVFPYSQKSPVWLLRYLGEHTNAPTRNAPPMILRGHYQDKRQRTPRTIDCRGGSLHSVKNGSPNNRGLFPIPHERQQTRAQCLTR